jgi:hypothetical protein
VAIKAAGAGSLADRGFVSQRAIVYAMPHTSFSDSNRANCIRCSRSGEPSPHKEVIDLDIPVVHDLDPSVFS